MSIKNLISARAYAIIIAAVISGVSFTLGFLVGGQGAPAGVTDTSELQIPVGVTEEAEPPTDLEAQTPAEGTASSKIGGANRTEPKLNIPPPLTEASIDKTYCVQVGAFKDRKDAEALKNDLMGKGYKIHVTASEGNVYKVRTGRLKNKKEADVLALRLKSAEKISAFVVIE